MNLKKEVLDKGFIEAIDYLGNDLTVANSARVSFGKRKKKYDKRLTIKAKEWSVRKQKLEKNKKI